MDLLNRMASYRRVASWAVWGRGADGSLMAAPFPADLARVAAHGRAMIVSLNPANDRAKETAENTADWANFHSPVWRHHDVFLAEAFEGTPYWGAYMADLHPDVAESDSSLIRSKPDEVRMAVDSLIAQAKLLGEVDTIICVGGKTHDSVSRHARRINDELGDAIAIRRITHYSGAAGAKHGHLAWRYRDLVHEELGLRESAAEPSGGPRARPSL